MTVEARNTEAQTLSKLYAALDSAIAKEQADLINVLSSAIQRLTR